MAWATAIKTARGHGPRLLVLVLPLALYLVGVHYIKAAAFNDPTSRFFDAGRAYRHGYSRVRTAQAERFVQRYNKTDDDASEFKRGRPLDAADPPYICAAVASVARPSGAVYVRHALASLLDGLARAERDILYVMPLLGHTNVTDHPMYGEPWLSRVADRVLTYADPEMGREEARRIEEVELERKRTGVPDKEKMVNDHAFALRTCAATGAPYVLLFEDDVVFVDGWFHRAMKALKKAEGMVEGDERGFYWLRLFNIQGSTLYPAMVLHILAAVTLYLVKTAVLAVAAVVVWRHYISGTKFGRSVREKGAGGWKLYGSTAAACFAVWTLLLFGSGMNHAAGPYEGVIAMENCCAQATIFPNKIALAINDLFRRERVGFVDDMAERMAKDSPEKYGPRLYVHPAAAQHVGAKSSKGDNWGTDKPGELTASQRAWNFDFEMQDAAALAEEHRVAVERFDGGGLAGKR